MAILPAEVRRPLVELRDRLHAVLDRWWPGGGREDEREAPQLLVRRAYSGPVADVEETDDAVIVRAELPGLRPEDFTVEATADRLIVRGEKRQEREEQGRGFHRVERRYGAFVRSIALPCEVDPDRAEAAYRDGVLRVTLPKTAAARARQIKISVR
ncbi:MAG: Hsp20/alpha crystallin family protein [Chloroflexi bacterium]|nr:Hsp20/alpha crystallin family protein [Chloroflexota bacterium]